MVKSVGCCTNVVERSEAKRFEALIHSDAARKGALEEHQWIKLSTHGIFFMGTPHQGGNGVYFGETMLKVASIFIKADNKILKHLERDLEWLQQQLGQYAPVSSDFVTKFAYETLPTPTVIGQSIMVNSLPIDFSGLLIMFRSYLKLRRSYRVLRMRSPSLYQQII